VNLVCGFRMEREKAGVAAAAEVVVRGSASSSRNCKALSTEAMRAGGLARSSGEASVMGAERRGQTIQAAQVANRSSREELHG
jgi:hypothetical protein